MNKIRLKIEPREMNLCALEIRERSFPTCCKLLIISQSKYKIVTKQRRTILRRIVNYETENWFLLTYPFN